MLLANQFQHLYAGLAAEAGMAQPVIVTVLFEKLNVCRINSCAHTGPNPSSCQAVPTKNS